MPNPESSRDPLHKEVGKYAPHHGGPDANPLITKAVDSMLEETQRVTNPPAYGPAIGSGGGAYNPVDNKTFSNHDPNDPRK
jgi:hypothetical protein